MSIIRRASLTLQRCTIVAMRSCHEWEPEAFSLAAKLLGKPVIPLGLLLPSPDVHRDVDVDTTAVHWLDAQPPKSVVYVALGSEVPCTWSWCTSWLTGWSSPGHDSSGFLGNPEAFLTQMPSLTASWSAPTAMGW
jgi:hypothetical protein